MQRHYFAIKGLSSQSNGFSSSHVWMWELDHKESWALKNWCFWTEKTRRSNLSTLKEISTEHSIGRSDAEDPIFWPPDAKSWLIEKDPDAGKDWGQEEKGMTEDEMAASLTRWTWVWVNSGSWWWIGTPGVLQSMGSQRVGHDCVTELNCIVLAS